ncbi:MAG: thiamine pyrophosphate-binding protein [Deltaproteobacteria bacterium]|nr:thiamine pyrophosphate-binding protein [Deltaproteobacteria bacterium]
MAVSKAEFGSDVVVDLLKLLGIEYTAFNPGATFRGIHDSIVNYGGNREPEVIECCHEEISVALAHGYAKASGKLMCAILHDIVGLQHGSMGIFNAWCDRVPVMVLGGTGPMDITKRRPWIDWIHTALVQGNLVRDYVKWDDQPANLASVPEALIRAYRIAVTEPKAPVYVNFDADIQEEVVTEPPLIPDLRRYRPPGPIQGDPTAMEQAAAWLVGAEHPVIIADMVGRNSKAAEALVRLAELLGAAVLDKGARYNFPSTHPLDLSGADRELLAEADVVLALDMSDLARAITTVDKATRAYRFLIREETKIIHICLNELLIRSLAHDFQRLQPVDLPILADTSIGLPTLVQLCEDRLKRDAKRQEAIRARAAALGKRHDTLRQKEREQMQKAWDARPISTARLTAEVWEVIKDEDWVLVNGEAGGWPRRLWPMNRPDQYLGRSGGAGVGYGMGASIGAALAHKGSGKLCVDLQADGDMLYTPSALWTAAHHQIPLLVVMHNNRSYWNSEEHAEELAHVRKRPVENAPIGTMIREPNVDFAKLAQSFALHGEGPIEDPREIRPAVQRALKVVKDQGTLALVDVVCQMR